jgi:hypothetical protein
MPKRKPTRPRHSWRDYEDRLHRSFPSMQNPESLHPGSATVIAAVCGSPEHRAIVVAYSGCVLPVRPATPTEVLQ